MRDNIPDYVAILDTCTWCGEEVPQEDLVTRGNDELCDLCLDEYEQLPEDRGDTMPDIPETDWGFTDGL